MLPERFMQGYCHVAALAFMTVNPKLRLLAHVGMEFNHSTEEDEIVGVDHVIAFDPQTHRGYDARGAHPNAEDAVALSEAHPGDLEFWYDTVEFTIGDVRKAVESGELKRITQSDFNEALDFAKSVLSAPQG